MDSRQAHRTTGTTVRTPSARLAWLLPAGIALLAGLDAGLLLLGLPAPVTTSRLPQVHGVLLGVGFFGTLISLERATALGRWYGYAAPALLGLGGIALLVDMLPLTIAKMCLVVGAAGFMLLYVPLWRRQLDAATLTQLLGAGLALAGTIIWIGQDGFKPVVPWLIGFLALTIAAERVELARITMGPRAATIILAAGWAITATLVIGSVLPDVGAVLLGVTLLAMVAWLIRHDIARRTIRSRGATRYMATCILAGYIWLAIAAVVLLFGDPTTQPAYDAVVHAVFLGYAFSMILAHATTILPAVLHIDLPYRGIFWAPAALLHLSLVVRIGVGDAFGVRSAWQLGGALGVAALLLFAVFAVGSALVSPAKKPAAVRASESTGAERA